MRRVARSLGVAGQRAKVVMEVMDGVHAIALPAGGLTQDARLAERVDRLGRRRFGRVEQLDDPRQRDYRVQRQLLQQLNGRDVTPALRSSLRRCLPSSVNRRCATDTPSPAASRTHSRKNAGQPSQSPSLRTAESQS